MFRVITEERIFRENDFSVLLFCHCLYFRSFYQICLPAWHGMEVFLWLDNSLWEQNDWGLQVRGLLCILDQPIQQMPGSDEMKFIFHRIMPFVFEPEVRNKFELRNMHFNIVYMLICVMGMRWCRMMCTVIPPAYLWHFCKLTEWLFYRSHPILLTLTPSSTLILGCDWWGGKRKGHRNVWQLQQFVVDEWIRTAQHTCLRYVASMLSRCQAISRANDSRTRYWSVNYKSQWNFSCYYDE